MTRAVYLLGVLALAAPRAVTAQDYRVAPVIPRTGYGPYIEAGGSVSVEGTSCDGCDGSTQIAAGLRSGAGWQFTGRVRVGVEVLGSFRDDPQVLQNLSHIVLTGQVGISDRLHLRVGVGQARLTQGSIIQGDRVEFSATGAGWMVGLGTELPLSTSLVLAPTATYRALGGVDLEREGAIIARNQSFRVFEIGFGLRYHLRNFLWPNPRDRAPA